MDKRLTCMQGQGVELRTAGDLARFMGRLMYDIANGSIKTREANSICRAAETVIRIAETQLEYNSRNNGDVEFKDVQLYEDA